MERKNSSRPLLLDSASVTEYNLFYQVEIKVNYSIKRKEMKEEYK